jgi:hypothetical protein
LRFYFFTSSSPAAHQPTMADQAEDAANGEDTPLCWTELSAANDCVTADPEKCGECFQGDFTKVFPIAVEGAYRDVLAYNNPEDPSFCNIASTEVCQ